MRFRTRWRAIFYAALTAVPVLSGCAAVAVAGAGDGINFTSSTAYRSFTYSLSQVHEAAQQALERMRIKKIKDEKSGDDFKMMGETEHLKISITLDPITPKLTKASINARKNWLMKDQTVAAEILIQMDQLLEGTVSAHNPN